MEMHGVENVAGYLLLVACVSVQQCSKRISFGLVQSY
jgi:hypothetical protein